jgi:glycerol-3-phosphate dehydrogenase
MRRSLQAMDGKTFDLAVVGGGITGACIARDAALRGLSVAIVEKCDWSSGTSSGSSKLVHGGLRYLKTFEVGLIRESLAERRIWERIAPHLVYPLPFLIPFFGEGALAKFVLGAGLTVYDLLSYDKGWLDDPDQRVPGHRRLSRNEAVALEPVLDQPGLDGAMLYYDCQMDAPERLGLECVQEAVANGAMAANYAEVTGFLREGDAVSGIEIKDRLSDCAASLRARITINATGPWADLLIAKAMRGKSSHHLMRSKGVHVIVPAITKTHALTVGHKGTHFFVLPWRGHTILGTTDTPFQDSPDALRVTEADIDGMLEAVMAGLPFLKLERSQVVHAYAGLRPLVDDGATSSYNASRRAEIVDHSKEGLSGLMSAIGGKWTTSRAIAEKVVNRAQSHLGQARRDPQTGVRPLPGGAIGRIAEFKRSSAAAYGEMAGDVLSHLTRRYGARFEQIVARARGDAALLQPLSNRVSDTGAAVIAAVQDEMAMTLADVVFRRTALGGLGHPGHTALTRAAEIMGGLLDWSPEKRTAEIEAVEAQFPVRAQP